MVAMVAHIPALSRAIWRDRRRVRRWLAQHRAGSHAAPFLDNAAQPLVVTPVRSDSGKFNPHLPMVEA